MHTGSRRDARARRPSGMPHFAVSPMPISSDPARPGHLHYPWLTGTSKASWVSSSIWILTVISFPEGVGGGFCPRSKVLIPEFSGAPRREAGVGFCSISPMMKAAYTISAGNKREKVVRRRGFWQCFLLALSLPKLWKLGKGGLLTPTHCTAASGASA